MMFRNYGKTSARRVNRKEAQRRFGRGYTYRRSHTGMEQLEDRRVLASIIWTDRGINGGADTDGFVAAYGAANAALARAVVDRAIDDWSTVIDNFNYLAFGGVGLPVADNTYTLSIIAADQGGGGRGVTNGISTDAQGKPYNASIQMDDNGGGAGWYFDANPSDDAEFTSLLSSFTADGSNALGGNDFYRTIVHEMGHAMGLLVGGSNAINSFLTAYGTDAVDGSSTLYLFQGATVNASFTDNGGGHTYEGPSVAGNPIHPNDLMNAGRTVGFPPPTRELITDLDAQILSDGYGYTIVLPSTINTFLANLNTQTGVLTVNGAPGTFNDHIVIDNNGSLRVIVNGTEEIFDGSLVTSINVLAGAGDDFIYVAADVGLPTTIDPGTGDDDVYTGGGETTVVSVAADGDDLIDFSNNPLGITFTSFGNDTVIGTRFDDTITAGNSGNVNFQGGDGDDTLTGNAGSDRLEGGAGRDILVGGAGSDFLLGGADADTLDGGAGDDQIDGGADVDTVIFQGLTSADDAITIQSQAGYLPFNAVPGPLVEINNGANSETDLIVGVEELFVSLNDTSTGDSVTVNSLIGTGVAVLTLDAGGTSGVNTVTINGTEAAENISIIEAPANPALEQILGLGPQITLVNYTANDDTLIVNGGGGDDFIRADAGVNDNILLTLNGDEGNDVLQGADIENGGPGDDVLKGSAGDDSLDGGAGNDTYIPLGGNDTITDTSGNDKILVDGTVGDDDFQIAYAANGLDLNVTVNGLTTTYVNAASSGVDAIVLNGFEGNDSLTIDNSNGMVAFAITYNGGEGRDSLRLQGDVSLTDSQYQVGPNADEGSILHVANSGTMNLYFTGLEPIVDVVPASNITISATNAANAISLSDGFDNGSGDTTLVVEIDAFESYEFANKGFVTIAGLGGDDHFDVSLAAAPDGISGIRLEGGPPSAGSDTVVINGQSSDDLLVASNLHSAGGDFDLTLDAPGAALALPTIELETMELVIFNGGTGIDDLQIIGSSDDETFVHTPSTAAPDAGRIDAFNETRGEMYIPIEYLSTVAQPIPTTVIIDGQGGADTLAVRGTTEGDFLDVDFAAALDTRDEFTLTTNIGEHTKVAALNFENYEVEMLAGDDHVSFRNISAAGDIDQVLVHADDSQDLVDFNFSALGTNDDALVSVDSNRLDAVNVRDVTTNTQFVVTGAELLNLHSANTATIAPGVDDQNVRVEASPNPNGGESDRITSSTFPTIDVEETTTLQIFALATTTVTFVTGNLGATDNYEAVLLSGDSTLVLEGQDGQSDSYTAALEAITGDLLVTDNNSTVVVRNIAVGLAGLLRVNGLGGDDTLEVDNTNGLISLPSGIYFAGGEGNDTLLLTGTTAVSTATYSVGSANDEGNVVHAIAGGPTQRVFFTGLEPVIDVVTAASAIVNATNGDNAINYTGDTEDVGNGPINTGVVSIDNFETYEFANKDTLTINALAGDDVIHIDNAAAPVSLTDITVNGGDPTASDRLVYTARPGDPTVNVAVNFTAQGAGNLSEFTGPTVSFTGIEDLHFIGQQNEVLDVNGTAGDDLFELYPGETEKAGTVVGTFNGGAYTGRFTYSNISDLLRSLNFNNGLVAPNGTDTFVMHGTTANDIFNASGGEFKVSTNGVKRLGISVLNMDDDIVTFEGHEGDDEFNVTNVPAGLTLKVNGGDPSASDVLNFTGSATIANLITVDFANSTVQEAGFGAVSFSGVEILNVDAAGHPLAIVGTDEDEDVTVTVLDAESGKIERGPMVQKAGEVQHDALAPLVNYTNVNGPVDFDLAGGEDTLIVVGNALAQQFDIDAVAGTVDLDDDKNGSNDGAITYSNTESLQVFGLEGDDLFNVTAGDIPVFIDGGDPIGTTAGDRIVVTAGSAVSFEPGPEVDEGGFRFETEQRVSFDHIESIAITDVPCVLVLGTNADDDITIVQRDATYDPLADGVQDFTVSVNGGPEVLYINVPLLHVDALAGDDDVVIHTLDQAAINNWGMEIFLVGGPPSGATGGQGDVFEFETEGADSVLYAPNGSDTGTVLLDSDATTVDQYDAGTDTIIHLVASFVDPCDIPYISSTGGFEQFVYDGEAGADDLAVVGNSNNFEGGEIPSNDRFTHTPGPARDAGAIGLTNESTGVVFLGITYQNLGPATSVEIYSGGTVPGIDTLVLYGTHDSETMSLSFTAQDSIQAILTDGYGQHVAIVSELIASYEVRLLEGDDVVSFAPTGGATPLVNATGTFALFGGGPSGSDALFLNGALGTIETVTIAPDAFNPLEQDITGLGARLDVSGFELIRYEGGDDFAFDDTLIVNLGTGDHWARVDALDNPVIPNDTDRVVSDLLPEIHFGNLNTFRVSTTDDDRGNDTVTFVTRNLNGALPGNYQADLGAFDTLVIEGADGDEDDYLVSNPGGGNAVAITDNSLGSTGVTVTEVNLNTGNVGRLVLNTLGGDDFVEIDNSGGLVDLASGIQFNGGAGDDLLLLDGTTAIDLAQYFVGTHDDEGEIVHAIAGGASQRIFFTGLEPVIDVVSATDLEIYATDADNAINYTEGANSGSGLVGGATTGQVTIDNYESFEFANKVTLTIFAGAGDDVINLNNLTNPAGLTDIFVDGGDPTGSDTLLVNDAVDGTTIDFTPLDADSATITGAQVADVTADNIELVLINGQEGDDTLQVTASAGSDSIVYTPGANADSGRVAVNSFVPLEFSHIGAGGTLAFVDQGGGADRLTINGTQGDDNFSVNVTGAGEIGFQSDVASVLGGTNHVLVTVPTAGNLIEGLKLNGFDGADNYVINASSPTLFSSGIAVIAGDPAAFDRVTLNATAVVDVLSLDLFAAGDSVTGIVGGAIQLSGVEDLTINGNTGNDSLTVNNLGAASDLQFVRWFSGGDATDTFLANGTAGHDEFSVVPLSSTMASISANSLGPVVTASLAAASTSTFTVDPQGDSDTVTVFGAAANDAITVAGAAGNLPTVTVSGQKAITITGASTESLVIAGENGNDTLTVNSSAAPVLVPLVFDGGIGADSIILTGGTASSDTYTPGPALGAGSSVIVFTSGGGGTQRLDFLNVEPVIDLVTVNVVGGFVVNANNADNAINYTQGPNSGSTSIPGLSGNTGLVSVDAQETIEFQNKSTLTINALAGDDVVNLNNPVNPAGLTAITVNGGDPTASDTVIVNGTAVANAVVVDQLTTNGARVTGAQAVPVTVTTAEQLIYNGQGGDDDLTVTTLAGSDQITLTPGTAFDSGTVTITGAFPTSSTAIPLAFQGLGAGGGSSLTFTNTGGGLDTLIYNGTQVSDTFSVTGATGTIVLNSQIPVIATGTNVGTLQLEGLDGDDTFNVTGALPYSSTIIDAGDPSASDVVNLSLATGAVTFNYSTLTVTGYGGTVSLLGVEVANLNTNVNTLTVNGTAVDDDLAVTVYSATSGKVELGLSLQKIGEVQHTVIAPVVNYSNITGALAVNLGTGDNTLTVVGSDLDQDFTVTGTSVAIDDVPNGVGNDGTVNFSNIGSLQVSGLEGDDTFTVTPAVGLPIFIDGGDPIGSTAGDSIIINAVGLGVTPEPGPENDEGGFKFNAAGPNDPADVSFDHIEALVIDGSPCVDIVGTNWDDDITIIARDSSYNAGADGFRDFTVSLNDGPDILFLNTPQLLVDGRAGDDDIVLRTPAPNNAFWAVRVYIAGGTPSAVTGDQGDVFELETPFQDTVIYTPNGSDSGDVLIDETINGVYDPATDTLISLGTFTDVLCIDELESSSEGGIEYFVYDGEGGNDNLTVVGTAGSDTIVHTPGAGFDEGSLRVNTLLGITYQNLGTTATFTVDGGTAGTDNLVAYGTGGSDTLIASRISAAVGSINVNAQLPLRTTGIETYTLDGLEGDDFFRVVRPLATGVTTVAVNGGGPSGSDVLTISGAAGTAEAFVLTPATTPGDGSVAVSAGGTVTTPYTGIEHVFLSGNAAGDADTLVIHDDRRDNIWDVSAGTVGDLVQIAGRESIDYSAFSTVQLVNDNGTDLFRVAPSNLIGFTTSFTVTGDATLPVDDVLELVGTPGLDVVTSGASTVTVNGVTITAGANLVRIQVDGLDSDDDINLSTFSAYSAIIYGDGGNDTIVGTTLADTIFGGAGNDFLVGAGGDDTVYGNEGDDTFGNPTGTANGTADDPGNDRFFGGDGSDVFFWEPGDGSDTIEGGAGEADILRFFGSSAVETFNLFASLTDPSRAILFRSTGAITINMAGIDQVDVTSNDGADNFVVGRANDGDSGDDPAPTSPYTDPSATLSNLSTTEIRVVNLYLNTVTTAAAQQVYVDGLPTDDNLSVSVESTATGVVRVSGLPYAVRVLGATTTDRLTIRGNEGNDTIKSANPTGGGVASVESIIGITLAGGAGNDYLSADAILIGGIGNDTLIGGAGNDQLFGNQGEDTMIGGGGQDTYDGGADYDTIVVNGTAGADYIDVAQTAAGTLEYTVTDQFGVLVEDATTASGTQDSITNVEQVQVNAGQGADTIRIRPADLAVTDISLRYTVDGGPDSTFDRLAVTDEGLADTFVYRKGEFDSEGTITVGAANTDPDPGVDGFLAPLIVFTNIERIDPRVSGPTSSNFSQGTVVVFKHDPFEYNDDVLPSGVPGNPTHLGANTTINVDPNIDPGADATFNLPSDVDYYRLEAEYTGTLDIQVFFRQVGTLASGRAGLPNDGNLDITVIDSTGDAIASGFGTNDNNDNERIRIPVVEGQIYYLCVFANGTAINNYTITTINHAPPVPFDIELDDNPANGATNPPGQTDNSDTGRSQFDNTTYDSTPTIFIRLDDGTFIHDVPGNSTNDTPVDEVIPIPFSTGAAGYRVAVFVENPLNGAEVFVGFAGFVSEGVYSFTFPAPLSDGSHFISARVQMVDPTNNDGDSTTGGVQTVTGYGARSQSLEIVVDTVPPPVSFGLPGDPDDGLTPDPGVIPQPGTFVDRKTNDQTPTFWGVAEANSIIRVYADFTPLDGIDNFDVLLGLTVALPYDGTNQYPNGYWSVTSGVDLNDPIFGQVDGLRRILVTAEDLAGNLNPGTGISAQALNIFLDTQGPQVTGVYISQSNLVGLGTSNTLLRFASDNPAKIVSTVSITGLVSGDTVVGIDYRPANNAVYAVVDGTASDRLYIVNPFTGAATLVGTLTTALSGSNFGVDFNPMSDRIRVVSDNGQNLRIDPITASVTVDTPLNGGAALATAAAYTNNVPGTTWTSLYVIDTNTDQLFLQNPPNTGTLSLVGALGVNATAINGFDIAQGTNTAYAALTVGGVSQLYTINLNTGVATLVGNVNTGATSLRGLTALAPYDLFDPKPSTDGPTPLVHSIVIRLQDLPARVQEFLNPAANPGVAIEPGHFHVVGDANGIIAIQSVTFLPDPVVVGQAATGSVVLTFVSPLPDDRFTLTVSDSVVDDVGNKLDGESNASEPQETPTFPSGDGQPGGDFVARFTIDSRPEVTTWAAGSVYVDTNGNFHFDPTNVDATNRDITYTLGFTSDNLLAGNFSAPGANQVADGFDKLAAYGRYGGAFRWLIDYNNDGVVDLVTTQTISPNSLPVAGNFDGNVVNGDEVGLFTGTSWVVDTNHDYIAETTIPAATTGLPVVGDFDGDGLEDFAFWRDDQFFVDLASNGYGQIDNSFYFGFIGTREQPIAGDYDRDGIDDLGLWVPDRAGTDPSEGAEWYLLISGGHKLVGIETAAVPGDDDPTDRVVVDPQDATGTRRIVNFTPVPFGNDLFAKFGDDYALPLFGNFDPPVASGTTAPVATTSLAFKNAANSLDVNGDGHVTNIDAFLVISALRTGGEAALPRLAANAITSAPYVDTSGDSNLTNLDAFLVVSHLRTNGESEGEGEAAANLGASSLSTSLVASASTVSPTTSESPVVSFLASPSPLTPSSSSLASTSASNSSSSSTVPTAQAVDAVLLNAVVATMPQKSEEDDDSLAIDLADFDTTLDEIAGELALAWHK